MLYVIFCGQIQLTMDVRDSTHHQEVQDTAGERTSVINSTLEMIWRWYAVLISWWCKVILMPIRRSVLQYFQLLTTVIAVIIREQPLKLETCWIITIKNTIPHQRKKNASQARESQITSCDWLKTILKNNLIPTIRLNNYFAKLSVYANEYAYNI